MKQALPLAAFLALLIVAYTVQIVSAQEERVVTGVVVGVETDGDGALTSFMISDSEGRSLTLTASDETSFGLENTAGDRWVGTLSEDPDRVALLLIEHRRSFSPVTVRLQGERLVAVVDAAPTRLETNLVWLAIAVAVVLVGIFGYVGWMSRRQSDLQDELSSIKASLENRSEDSAHKI